MWDVKHIAKLITFGEARFHIFRFFACVLQRKLQKEKFAIIVIVGLNEMIVKMKIRLASGASRSILKKNN